MDVYAVELCYTISICIVISSKNETVTIALNVGAPESPLHLVSFLVEMTIILD